MYCRHCGKLLADDTKFCNYCGQRVADEDIQPQPSQQNSPTKPYREPEAPYQETVSTCQEEPVVADYTPSAAKSEPIHHAERRKPPVVPVLIGAVVVLAVAIVAWLVLDGMKKPSHVSETGEYTIRLNESMEFSSTGSAIGFESVSIGEPEYDPDSRNVIAKMEFLLHVDIPGKKHLDEYAEWLTNFTVNGNPATYSVRKLWPDSNDCWLEYIVKYDSTPADASYQLTCKVNDQLTLRFPYNQSFFNHVDRASTVAIGQAGLDAEYGITTVDWQSDADDVNYIEGQTYAMTGKIVSFGKYMGDLTDLYYITLSAKNSLLTDTHCYFSAGDWAYAPSMENGDIITIYGAFEFESFGWNFENCSFFSPAGNFTIKSDGTSEIVDPYMNMTPQDSQEHPTDTSEPEPEPPIPEPTMPDIVPSDWSVYNGRHVEPHTPFDEGSTFTEGYAHFEAEIYVDPTDSGTLHVDLTVESHSDSGRVAEVSANGEIEGNSTGLSVAFEDDGWGNSGTLYVMFLDNGKIGVECAIAQYGDDAMWSLETDYIELPAVS